MVLASLQVTQAADAAFILHQVGPGPRREVESRTLSGFVRAYVSSFKDAFDV